MIRKRILLNTFLAIAVLGMVQAQDSQKALTGVKLRVAVDHFEGFRGEFMASKRLFETSKEIKQEVYWPLGVNNPHFQIDKPIIKVYSYKEKPKLGDLSNEVNPVALNGKIDVPLLPASNNRSNYQDNLAPSIQITF